MAYFAAIQATFSSTLVLGVVFISTARAICSGRDCCKRVVAEVGHVRIATAFLTISENVQPIVST